MLSNGFDRQVSQPCSSFSMRHEGSFGHGMPSHERVWPHVPSSIQPPKFMQQPGFGSGGQHIPLLVAGDAFAPSPDDAFALPSGDDVPLVGSEMVLPPQATAKATRVTVKRRRRGRSMRVLVAIGGPPKYRD